MKTIQFEKDNVTFDVLVFDVFVVAYNKDTFRDNYDKYIVKEQELWYNDAAFTLVATKEIYDEIDDLGEEQISIIK